MIIVYLKNSITDSNYSKSRKLFKMAFFLESESLHSRITVLILLAALWYIEIGSDKISNRSGSLLMHKLGNLMIFSNWRH